MRRGGRGGRLGLRDESWGLLGVGRGEVVLICMIVFWIGAKGGGIGPVALVAG